MGIMVMKKLMISVAAAVMLPFAACLAQTAEDSPLLLDAVEYDFGKINEADGIVEHTFSILNRSDHQVRIDHVYTSCGCTTTSYSTDFLDPGEITAFTVAFNPAGTEGRVFREIEIFTEHRKSCDRISLMADVTPAPIGIEQMYPIELTGGVRTAVRRIPFGYQAHGKTAQKSMILANASDKTVKLEASVSGKMLTAECPLSLEPGMTESVVLTYSIPQGVYGTVFDTIWVSVDGVRSSVPVVANAICTDDFSLQKSNPKLTLNPSFKDFGEVARKKKFTQVFTLGNEGDADLIVRAVEVAEGTVTDLKAGTVIRPGDSVKVSVTIKSSDKPDTLVTGSINAITNDPVRPRREIRTSARTK